MGVRIGVKLRLAARCPSLMASFRVAADERDVQLPAAQIAVCGSGIALSTFLMASFRAVLTPSPPYSGERVGVRGGTSIPARSAGSLIGSFRAAALCAGIGAAAACAFASLIGSFRAIGIA